MTIPIREALLDTDTLSLYQRGHPEVRARGAEYLRGYHIFTFSELTRYEVVRGFTRSGATTRLAAFERLCQLSQVLPFDEACMRRAATVWADLQRLGQPIGEVDVLIAGTALAHGLAVVTRNVAHFRRVGGLEVLDWTAPST